MHLARNLLLPFTFLFATLSPACAAYVVPGDGFTDDASIDAPDDGDGAVETDATIDAPGDASDAFVDSDAGAATIVGRWRELDTPDGIARIRILDADGTWHLEESGTFPGCTGTMVRTGTWSTNGNVLDEIHTRCEGVVDCPNRYTSLCPQTPRTESFEFQFELANDGRTLFIRVSEPDVRIEYARIP